jgi:hypothetical protein
MVKIKKQGINTKHAKKEHYRKDKKIPFVLIMNSIDRRSHISQNRTS